MTDEPTPADPVGRRMRLRYRGLCRECGAVLAAGTQARYDPGTKTVRCLACPSPTGPSPEPLPPTMSPAEPTPASAGTAGTSARQEYERRKARDQARIRDRWGRLGGIAAALSGEKPSTRAWAKGAAGEERLGTMLDGLPPETVGVLHDRRIPGSRANIDHLVITTGGVWVIDAKRYTGQPELRVDGGWFRPRVETLRIGGRDGTGLVDGVLRQVELVRAVVDPVPVTGVLCFVDAEWPLIGGSFTARQVHVLWPRKLLALLQADTGSVDVAACRSMLAARFPPA